MVRVTADDLRRAAEWGYRGIGLGLGLGFCRMVLQEGFEAAVRGTSPDREISAFGVAGSGSHGFRFGFSGREEGLPNGESQDCVQS